MNNKETETENIENRLKRLEDMLVHIHGHIENIYEYLEGHDIRIRGMLDVIYNPTNDEERKKLSWAEHPRIDIVDQEELKSPITDKEMVIHKKRLEILRELEYNDELDEEEREKLWSELHKVTYSRTDTIKV